MTDTDAGYLRLVAHYEACLDRHGDTHLGVDWPNAEDARTRYRVMLDLIGEPAPAPVSLLDFGCGAGHLLDHIRATGEDRIDYRGLDASAKFVALCRRKFPDTVFHQADVLRGPVTVTPADYVVLNGVLTEKRELSDREMRDFMETLLSAVWPLARKGLAFNVMSCQVDWQRDDLFHMPFDDMARFVAGSLSRHFRFRQDYGLYEYTTYVYRMPRR
jgi:SAM-dependent methyltransferase